jgi:hypothetical protein
MKEDKDKKKKLVYLVIFFSSIIFVISLFFIKYELALTYENKSTTNFNWQQIGEEFNQMTDIIKQNFQNLTNLNTQTVNATSTVLTNEEVDLLKEKIEEININTNNNINNKNINL